MILERKNTVICATRWELSFNFLPHWFTEVSVSTLDVNSWLESYMAVKIINVR